MHHEGRIEEEELEEKHGLFPSVAQYLLRVKLSCRIRNRVQIHSTLWSLNLTVKVMLVLSDVSFWEIITRVKETMQCLKILRILHK